MTIIQTILLRFETLSLYSVCSVHCVFISLFCGFTGWLSFEALIDKKETDAPNRMFNLSFVYVFIYLFF